ncbi:hypothetical protein [Saccharolobus islandicus]|uniref:Uncharacterized protein n=3 Tax=Saccharolobus islandicus TaxID=43080 RepID=F0NC42_SACI5|nr:hypothetical protein [Sulfolobus islandicus]ADX83787.1 conserved hypothetical protein [Sulfolobus islandicus HVE10/4]ADX86481.1 hypothetical protein SiRe_2433 [Sulfolobus islandicus REY15A]WCM37498.1 hypothetical protein GO599_08505 [Sulfolobus islandicus]
MISQLMTAHEGGRERLDGRDYRDVRPVPLDSKESHDPHVIKMSVWSRAKSLHLIMIEDKMSGMKV